MGAAAVTMVMVMVSFVMLFLDAPKWAVFGSSFTAYLIVLVSR